MGIYRRLPCPFPHQFPHSTCKGLHGRPRLCLLPSFRDSKTEHKTRKKKGRNPTSQLLASQRLGIPKNEFAAPSLVPHLTPKAHPSCIKPILTHTKKNRDSNAPNPRSVVKVVLANDCKTSSSELIRGAMMQTNKKNN